MRHSSFFLMLLLTLTLGCSGDDDNNNSICDKAVLLDPDQFQNGPADSLVIQEASIEGDCLNITFSSSGCSGDSWTVELLDSGTISKSLPPQRSIRLSLDNPELCEAYITRELSFDISKLRTGADQVVLKLQDFEDSLRYEY